MTGSNDAVGLIEVYGLAAAFAAGDAACKAANVSIDSFDRNKPARAETLKVPLNITVKIRGSVSDVEAGVEAAVKAAKEVSDVVAVHIIPKPDAETEKMISINVL